MRRLSIIIATLNEAASLPATVETARRAAGSEPFELIVSDCGSRDDTAGIARRLGAVVATGGKCRSDALNRGAAVAAGDVLLFLHADTTVPAGFVSGVRRALACPAVVGGAFEFAFDSREAPSWLDRRLLDVVVLCNRVRFRYSRGFFGDQGVFVRRAVFDRLGGFPPVRLMEDLTFCRAMGRLGRTAILTPPALTSPRRFLARGVLRQFGQDLLLLCCDSWGLCPQKLWVLYNAHNRGPSPLPGVVVLPPRLPEPTSAG